ncbi:MAG TPA: electron transfer flavoprotein subunit beta/FixA family protein [Myxococcota bacterium]|nr:electron transfer flavoprotein subunit beta/FixA family protein [Myxococcota bacterium]HQK51923.1 electron transfer flavoprotein subunit beta/FixA family protein [Myxococcota bacterium]
MKILVTAKRVTDPDAKIRVKPDGTGIETAGLEYKLNPFCENAIEAAVSLVEKHGGEAVAVTIGGPEVEQNLRTALAMGCERAIRVDLSDEALDSDLAARILAKVFEAEKPDLFLLGKQAVDGDSNQVTQLLAEYLGLPQACFISKIAIEGSEAVVTREVDGGLESIAVTLPAIVSADLRLNTPRLPTLPNVLKAKRKPIQVLAPGALGVDVSLKVVTERYEAPPQRKGGIQVKTVEELVDKLVNEAKAI